MKEPSIRRRNKIICNSSSPALGFSRFGENQNSPEWEETYAARCIGLLALLRQGLARRKTTQEFPFFKKNGVVVGRYDNTPTEYIFNFNF